MTTGHIRVSSAGMVADALATFIDDGFRLRTDAISARRRLVASLFAVAAPLVDGGGRQVTRAAERAGAALWRGAQKTEQVGATVADEAADAGREGARAVRDAAARRAGSAPGAASSSGTTTEDGIEDLEVVEVVEVVGPDPAGVEIDDVDPIDGVPDEGPTAMELAAGAVIVDEVDTWDDDELLDEEPAVLDEAAEVGGVRGEVPEVVADEAVARITDDAAPARRAGRRTTPSRPRTASRPARRDQPRDERRDTAASGSRDRRG